MADVNSKIEAAKTQVENLTLDIDVIRSQKRDVTLGEVARSDTDFPAVRGPPATKCRRTLKGHFGKVVAMDWSGDSSMVASASQDGKLILWNAVTTNKRQIIDLKSNYVLTVGMEQKRGQLVACGGLDNLCTVYKLSEPNNAIEMASHEGYLSCCRFLNERHILTSSGDSTCIRWDIASGRVLDVFSEHRADVMHVALSPTDPNVFASGSVDKTAKVWDVRDPSKSVMTFMGHEGDINGVDFMPSDSNVFGTGGDDGTCRIFDLRSCNEVNMFGKVTPTALGEREGYTSVGFSRSGRILFAGHVDSSVAAFDVLSDKNSPAFTLQGHDSHVTDVGVNPKGDALCTCSWDTTLKIWA